MYPIKIYASRVSNLTDARYFSAMGVDLIGFNLDHNMQASTIESIISWVEGPLFVGETSAIHISPTNLEILKKIGLTTFLINSFYEAAEGLDSYMIRYDSIEMMGSNDGVLSISDKFKDLSPSFKKLLKSTIMGKKCYIDISIDAEEIPSLLEEINPYGLVLKGGDEDRIGVKSFDELNDFLEKLEEFSN